MSVAAEGIFMLSCFVIVMVALVYLSSNNEEENDS